MIYNDICILKYLHPGKSNGPDEISTKMLQLCGDTVIIPLKIIIENILSTGIIRMETSEHSTSPQKGEQTVTKKI